MLKDQRWSLIASGVTSPNKLDAGASAVPFEPWRFVAKWWPGGYVSPGCEGLIKGGRCRIALGPYKPVAGSFVVETPRDLRLFNGRAS